MQCTSPRTVGFMSDGKTLCWSKNRYSKEFAPFQIPCGKCISCRLEIARQTAVRCVHEAKMHASNCFITLTYDNENIGSNRLEYAHFQKFVKDLRNNIFQELLDKLFPSLPQSEQRRLWRGLPKERKDELYGNVKIGVFCAGEYGDRTKRAHWHALIFNWRPVDARHKYTSERGDRVFDSDLLTRLWGRGIAEFGDVTFESAGYCARYATKKLLHGRDGEHDFEPISRRSCKQAIGKSWIAKYWRDVFAKGYIVLPVGGNYIRCGIPRYYEKWLRVHQPEAFRKYVSGVKSRIVSEAIDKEALTSLEEKKEDFRRASLYGLAVIKGVTRRDSRIINLERKLAESKRFLKV